MDLKQVGKYDIISKLGEGGFGSVYLAHHTKLQKQVALKILHPQVASDEMLAAYFEREALALARLEHQNIVRVYDYDQIDGLNFIVMEYVDGTNLDRILNEKNHLSVADSIPIFDQLLAALGYAHNNGIVHRDVKPSNIMITKSKVVKITDFGIAKVAGSAKLTRTGTGAGSLLYMSPEQIRGKDIDNRSDLYSVGVTLYQVLVGRTPFEAETDYEIMTGHLEKPPMAPSQIRQSIRTPVDEFIIKSLEKKPEKRYQTADEMASALRLLPTTQTHDKTAITPTKTGDLTIPTSPPVYAPSVKKAGGGRGKIIGTAVGLIVLSVAVIFYLMSSGGTSKEQKLKMADSLVSSAQKTANDIGSNAGKDTVKKTESETASTTGAATGGLQLELPGYEKFVPVTVEFGGKKENLSSSTFAKNGLAPGEYPIKVEGNGMQTIQQRFTVDKAVVAKTLTLTPKQSGNVGAVVIEVENYKIFEPVSVIVDGKSVKYDGQPITFSDLSYGVHEVGVVTDIGRFTDVVRLESAEIRKTFSPSQSQSKVTIASLVENNPDELVAAQVYIDNEKVKDGETPYPTRLLQGPHKIWIDHPGYRTIDKPIFIDLREDQLVELRLRKK